MLVVPSALAVVFSGIGLSQTAGGRRPGRGLAVAGLVLGLVGVALAAAFWGYVILSDECSWEGGELICES